MAITAGQGLLAGQIVSAVGGMFGSIMTASATKNALEAEANIAAINARTNQMVANAQAKIDEINAQTEEYAAGQEMIAGQRREQNVLLQGAQLKSTQRASMAANGIDIGGSDTAINILASTELMKQEDAKQVALEALRAAWGHRTQATNYQSEADLRRAMGKAGLLVDSARANGLAVTASAISPAMAGASSLLTSASSIGSKYFAMKASGLWDNNNLSIDDMYKMKIITG